MNKKHFSNSIIKESRVDENRTPFTPDQIQTLSSNFPNLNILVQPSKNRCFKDKDYSKVGAKIEKDISQSDIIFGIKEVEISKLIENKTYLFFSHTSKIRNDNSQSTQDAATIYKKKLLREILKKKIIGGYYPVNNEIDDSKESLIMTQDIMPLSKYSKKIDLIKSYLKNGDVYQINFTSKKKFKSTFNNSFDLYNSLKLKAKPKQGFFLHTNKFDILSFSPELFIKIDDGKIQTSPIKGTRPRSQNKTKDLALKKELINSKKDKAEHLMIVDLLRNDLGKICKIGSIKLSIPFGETFNNVSSTLSLALEFR
mgnify:CR=1 FL=1